MLNLKCIHLVDLNNMFPTMGIFIRIDGLCSVVLKTFFISTFKQVCLTNILDLLALFCMLVFHCIR